MGWMNKSITVSFHILCRLNKVCNYHFNSYQLKNVCTAAGPMSCTCCAPKGPTLALMPPVPIATNTRPSKKNALRLSYQNQKKISDKSLKSKSVFRHPPFSFHHHLYHPYNILFLSYLYTVWTFNLYSDNINHLINLITLVQNCYEQTLNSDLSSR